MGSTFGRRALRYAPCLLTALLMALVLAVGAPFERACANDAAEGSLVTGEPMLVSADDDGAYPLWIGKTRVTSENLAGSGWSFDPGANTLTLNGFSYEGAGHEETARYNEDDEDDDYYYRHSPIYWNDEESALIVELEGENSVIVAGSPLHGDIMDRFYGVFSGGGLVFKGAGSLVAHAGDIEQPDEGDSETSEPEGVGIQASRDVVIAGGSVSAIGYDSGIESERGTISIGANAGTVTAQTTGPTSSSPSAINASGGGVRIDGGTVTAIGYHGIYTANGIVVNGGAVFAQTNVPDTYGGSIMTPSGIYSENAKVIVNGGSVNAKGFNYGICSGFFHDEDEDDEEAVANGVVVNGGSVIAEATGPNEGKNTGYGISVDGAGGGTITVAGGFVRATASGKDGIAISAPGSVTIGEGVASFIAMGAGGAFTKDTSVKNAVAGIGATNVEGTEGKTVIEANTAGQALNDYKRASFPAAQAAVATDPSGKKLTYTGKPQELVTAGVADGGELQYSLDGKTYAATLPTATNVGNYTIYYKVVGDESHTDSEVKTVTSSIVAKTAATSKSSTAKTGDSVGLAALVAAVVAILAAVALVLAAKRRTRD